MYPFSSSLPSEPNSYDTRSESTPFFIRCHVLSSGASRIMFDITHDAAILTYSSPLNPQHIAAVMVVILMMMNHL